MAGSRLENEGARIRFRATKELAERAKVCTRCHVGRRSPDGLLTQEVNHDLIAAGHPRLNFEFAAYQENLPVHWDEKERNAAADFPAPGVGRRSTRHHEGRLGTPAPPGLMRDISLAGIVRI